MIILHYINVFYAYIFRYTNNKIFKIIDDNFIILECLNSYLNVSNILQYSLEEQSKLFGCMTISSSVSPVSVSFVFINKLIKNFF